MSFENKNFCETCGSLNNIIRDGDTLNYYCTNYLGRVLLIPLNCTYK